MFPYRVKCTESEYDIQNINLLYKIEQPCQHIFDLLENVHNLKKNKIKHFEICFYYLYNPVMGCIHK